jgi:iron complex outermembrane receptor protein
MALTSGNKRLRPEKSQDATLGVVLEPIDNLTLELDGWSIAYKDHIGAHAAPTVFGDATTFASYCHRNAKGLLSTDGSSWPGTDHVRGTDSF